MDLKELKTAISIIESSESNIKSWENLSGRELMVIPTDSEVYKEFKHFVNERSIYYDGKQNPQPIFISSMSKKVCKLIIDDHLEFAKPYKDKINPFLENKD